MKTEEPKHKHTFKHYYYPYKTTDGRWCVNQLVCNCGKFKNIKEKEW